MSINLKVLIVALSIWTAAAIREHVVKSHDPVKPVVKSHDPVKPVASADSIRADSLHVGR